MARSTSLMLFPLRTAAVSTSRACWLKSPPSGRPFSSHSRYAFRPTCCTAIRQLALPDDKDLPDDKAIEFTRALMRCCRASWQRIFAPVTEVATQ